MTDSSEDHNRADVELFASHVTFSQEGQAIELAERILNSRSRLTVLHGRVGIGKTGFIREYLLPRLRAASDREVLFSVCQPELPDVARATDGIETPIQDALRRPAIIVVDGFDRFLALGDAAKEGAVRSLFGRLQEAGVQGKIVVVVDDASLSRVFELRAYEPEVLHAVFPIQELDIEHGLATIGSADEEVHLSFSQDLVAELRVDIQRTGEGVSPELLKALYHEFRKLHLEGRKKVLSAHDYRSHGGLSGLLHRYLRGRLDRVERSAGRDERLIADAVLDEIVASDLEGRPVDLEEVQRRFNITEEQRRGAIARMTAPGGVLRELVPGVFAIAPSHLAQVVRQHLVEQASELERPLRLATEGHKNWTMMGVPLPEDRYREVDRHRLHLRIADEQVQFMLRCSLLYDASSKLATARYWCRRVAKREDTMGILLEHLYHRFDDVRVRAVTLLDDFDVPEVRDQLYLIALQDESAPVRAAAVSSLEGTQTEELRDLLLREARDPRSPHRKAAVQVLRIFRDRETAIALQGLVNDSDTEAELRDEATRVLAALGVSEGVDALLDIGLHDPDADDRERAAAALSSLESPELNRHLLEKLRRPPAATRRRVPAVLFGALRAVGLLAGAALLTLLALVLHGLLLTMTKRRRLGYAFFCVEATALLLYFVGGTASLPAGLGVALWFFNGIASLAASGGVLLGGVRDGSLRVGSLRHMLAGTVLLPLGVVSYSVGHGLAHALVRRFARALYLFAMGWVGFAILYFMDRPTNGPALSNVMSAVGWLLFLGSLVYDFGAVAGRWLLFARRWEPKHRRQAVLRSVVSNPAAVEPLFDGLGSGDRRKSRWYRETLVGFADAMPSAGLIERFKKGDPSELPVLIRCLKKMDNDAGLDALTRLYREAEPVVRRRIVRILAGDPSQRSLATLERLREMLGPLDSARCSGARELFRLKQAPKTAFVLVLLAGSTFALEYWDAEHHPERKVLKLISSPPRLEQAVLAPSEIVLTLGKRSSLAGAMAEGFPEIAAGSLLSALEESQEMSPLIRWTEVQKALAEHQSSLVKALTTVAGKGKAKDEIAEGLERALQRPGVEDPLARELRMALVAVHSHRRDAGRVAELLGITAFDSPDAWRDTLASCAADQRRALIEAFGALGTKEAIGALTESALEPITFAPGRGEASKLPEVLRADRQVDDQCHVVTILKKQLSDETREVSANALDALRTIYREGSPRVRAEARDVLVAQAEDYGRRALDLLVEERNSEARELLEKAVGLDDENGRTQGYLALALAREDALDEAMPHARRAIELAPDLSAGYSALRAGSGQQWWREAAAILEPVRREHPSDTLPLESLAYVYHEGLAVDDVAYFGRSHALFQRLVELSPEDPGTRANYVESCLTTARYEEAVRLGRELLAAKDLEPGIAIPIRLFVYAALILDRKWAKAERALDELESARSTNVRELSWSFQGTASFVRREQLPADLKTPLLRAFELMAPGALPDVLEASRPKLRQLRGDKQ